MALPDENDLLEALMRQAVSQCIDIERLAYLEESLIEMMVADDRDHERVTRLVQDSIDRTWQELMFEFERIRAAESTTCAVFEADQSPRAFSMLLSPPPKPT